MPSPTSPAAIATDSLRPSLLGVLLAVLTTLVGVLSFVEASAMPPAAHAQESAVDPEAVVAQLADELKRSPKDPEGWQALARAYGAMGRDADAVQAYRQALAYAPKDAIAQAQAHADLGRVIGRANGRAINPESEELLNKALTLDPNNVMANALLGRVALQRGQTGQARAMFETALAHLDANHPFAEQLRHAIQLAGGQPAAAASAAAR